MYFSDTSDDCVEFSEQEYALIGRNTGIRFTIGDKIKIKVVRADLDKRQIDFHLAEMPEQRERKALPKLKKDLKSGNIKKKR